MSGVNEIRSTFLDYFKKNGHEVVPSSPLVPRNDPTLMFTNAGMVQFKNVFTGLEQRPYSTAATAQKCVRAGGKHNDLDNVGYTARHHTFFEMLGNFSFGDYFKERAIELAWNLITKEFGIDAKRLLVTVYHTDDEAFGLWKKIAGLSDDRIIRIPTSDNFWAMGDTGPCGPCSEIFYDHGEHIWGGPPGSQDEDGDRFIEIWNLVFMQYEQVTKEERVDLPRPSIDTGMGLERVAALLQGKHDNYDIDLFRALIEASEEATGVKAEGDRRASHRVIADHLRSSAFLIADGVLPSNEGRGYVLRRIMRRAMRHAQLLGAREPLMWKLLPALVQPDGPRLSGTDARRGADLRDAEARGNPLPQDAGARPWPARPMRPPISREGDRLDGETAFKLYDTYGFPLDLTQDALRARGIGVDTDAFSARDGAAEGGGPRLLGRLRRQGDRDHLVRAQGKASARPNSSATTPRPPKAWSRRSSRDGKAIEAAAKGETVQIVLNQTPFYGESGGQMGDTGVIVDRWRPSYRSPTRRSRARAFSCIPASSTKARSRPATPLRSTVDHARRSRLRANHSATHLAARGAARSARHPCGAEGLAGRARAPAFRRLASEADDGRGTEGRRGDGQRDHRAERAGHDAADERRRRDRRGCDGAVRRKIRR